MKVIMTVIRNNEFQSDVISTPMDWKEFKMKISHSLGWLNLQLFNVKGTSLMYDDPYCTILPYTNKYWYLVNDDNQIMIRALNDTNNTEETYLFERVYEE